MATGLYESPHEFVLVAKGECDDFTEMAKVFNHEIRPATCAIRLVETLPVGLIPVDESQQYVEECWLQGDPLSGPEINQLLFLTAAGLPEGGVDFSHEDDAWVFLSKDETSEDAKVKVRQAFRKMGIVEPIKFRPIEKSPSDQIEKPRSTRVPGGMALISSKSSYISSNAVRHLVAEDEADWRSFLDSRSALPPDVAGNRQKEFSCLFDAGNCGAIRLAELLTIYDRVDVIPDRNDPNWLRKHDLSVADFLKLASWKRCRLILPYSVENCRPDLLNEIAELDSSAVVLSRSLAAKTVLAGQFKEPLLHGPFTAMQRSEILRALYKIAPDDRFKTILTCYGEMFRRQHYVFMMNGAMASVSCGVGAYLGEVFNKLHGRDARLELSLAGAGMEWAMALGSTWIPRDFGGGYDETGNCHFIASFLGRTKAAVVDPVSPRMHLLADGLLAISDVPPLEVAKNFNSASVHRFRNLAHRLMRDAPTRDEMVNAIAQINEETLKFERRTARLERWKIDTLLAGAIAGPISNEIDNRLGPFSSVIAAWLYEQLKAKVPSAANAHLSDAIQTLVGLALAPSADAVVVSRSRRSLQQD